MFASNWIKCSVELVAFVFFHRKAANCGWIRTKCGLTTYDTLWIVLCWLLTPTTHNPHAPLMYFYFLSNCYLSFNLLIVFLFSNQMFSRVVFFFVLCLCILRKSIHGNISVLLILCFSSGSISDKYFLM